MAFSVSSKTSYLSQTPSPTTKIIKLEIPYNYKLIIGSNFENTVFNFPAKKSRY